LQFHSHYHCCGGKAIRTSYIFWVCVCSSS
jgi:hypothetical protein